MRYRGAVVKSSLRESLAQMPRSALLAWSLTPVQILLHLLIGTLAWVVYGSQWLGRAALLSGSMVLLAIAFAAAGRGLRQAAFWARRLLLTACGLSAVTMLFWLPVSPLLVAGVLLNMLLAGGAVHPTTGAFLQRQRSQ